MRFLPLLTLGFSIVYAQTPDADSLTKLIADTTKNHKTVQFVTETTVETTTGNGIPGKMTGESSATLVNPGKSRIESKMMGMSTIVVSNPESTYLYTSFNKQYVKMAGALGPGSLVSSLGVKLPDMAGVKQTYKPVREETIEIDGSKYDCWVIESAITDLTIPGQPDKPTAKMSGITMTMWVDKKLAIDVKSSMQMKMEILGAPQMEMHQSLVKKHIRFDEPVDDALFSFTPPPDAKEVKELSFAGAALPKANLTGKEAPVFEIKGLDGKVYNSTALRGKTVLLDFWATWCSPCRASMPTVEKLSAEYRDRGLVVLAVDTGEDRSIVEEFIKKTPFAYPVALTGASDILETYQVNVFPTFVLIDPDGKVVGHEVGFGGESSLREMIGKSALDSAKSPAKKP